MSGLEGLRILVVEDEPIIAMCLEDILEGLGCITIGPAAGLCEGLELARTPGLDAAILDINLGSERSTGIGEVLALAGVPFAFASGYGAVPEGFEDRPLIEKPYRDSTIEAALRSLIG